LLYFNAAAAEYVTVLGTATLVTDSAEKARHWKEEWAAFYKDCLKCPEAGKPWSLRCGNGNQFGG
jgi:general stress protein 26